MMGSRRCEYCYCISGARKCIRPKCLLPLPGCTPLYAPHSCCPVAYNCTRECSLHSPRIQIITHTAFSSSLFFKISIRRRWRRSRETVSETLHLFPPFFFFLLFFCMEEAESRSGTFESQRVRKQLQLRIIHWIKRSTQLSSSPLQFSEDFSSGSFCFPKF